MKRVRIQKPSGRRHSWIEVLPLDPRDPEVVRAKSLAVTVGSWKALRQPTGGGDDSDDVIVGLKRREPSGSLARRLDTSTRFDVPSTSTKREERR